MKKAVLIIACRNFQDWEYSATKEVLEDEGIKIKTASDQKGIAIGKNGLEIKIDLSIEEIKLRDFEAVIFIGGGGALEHLDNEISYNLIKETIKQNKILAAICVSPVILAKAGILKNKKATVWWSSLDKKPLKILEENSVEFVDKNVVSDGKIITANGPAAAKEFGESILKVIR